jgi:hypothetical protein
VQSAKGKEKRDKILDILFIRERERPPRVPGKLEWFVGKQPEHARKRRDRERIGDEVTATTKRLDFANRILLAGNDSQTFTGIYHMNHVR